MSKKISFLVSLALCLMLALPGYADKPSGNKGKGGGKDTLKATFRDCTGDNPYIGYVDPTGLEPDCPSDDDRIKSDGVPLPLFASPYVGGVDGQTQINKNFFLLLLDESSPRRIFLDFNQIDCVALCTAPSDGLLGEVLATQGTSLVALITTKADDLRRLPLTDPFTSIPVTIKIVFRDEDFFEQAWVLRFDPFNENCVVDDTNEATFASATPTGASTWVFEASPSATACLLKVEGGKGHPRSFQGFYHMPFQLVVVKK